MIYIQSFRYNFEIDVIYNVLQVVSQIPYSSRFYEVPAVVN